MPEDTCNRNVVNGSPWPMENLWALDLKKEYAA